MKMATPGIVTEDRVILFTDVHDFSVALNTLAEDLYSFLQEMYEVRGDIIVGHIRVFSYL
jgi:hypothetical protein